MPLKDDLLGDTSLQLLVLLAAAGCVLLIACSNIASLLLARALSRRGEMAVRAAVGATRMRLVRQMMVEALIVSLAGGALGFALAPAAIAALAAMIPTTVPAPPVSVLEPGLLTFAFLLSIATGAIFSLIPAVQMTRSSLTHALQQGGRAGIGGRTFARDALVVTQIAVALVLLAGAGLLIRTLANITGIDLGFRADHLLTLRTSLPVPKYQDPVNRLAFYDRVVAGIRALPGVEDAAYASMLPFLSIGNTTGYVVEGREPAAGQDVLYRLGTPGHLRSIGAEVLEGRLPDERDGRDAPPIVVVNETFAHLHWPKESAIGRRLRVGGSDRPWRTVIGVVKDVQERGYEIEMKPAAYIPYAQVLTGFSAGVSRGSNVGRPRRHRTCRSARRRRGRSRAADLGGPDDGRHRRSQCHR